MSPIRVLVLGLTTVSAVVLYAQAPVDFIETVKTQGPRCYQLVPGQTSDPVQSISVKVSNQDLAGERIATMAFLNVSIKLKNQAQTQQAFLLCEADGHCSVECDGGSVRVLSMNESEIKIHNNEFYADASCSPDSSPTEGARGDLISTHVFSAATLSRVENSVCN